MFCLACTATTGESICASCARGMRPAPEVSVGGIRVIPAYTHEGAARALVHALKYRGLVAAAAPFADRLAERLTPAVPALVPVPRAVTRVIRHGVDPAAAVATALSVRTGVPVVDALRAPLWWPRHAGAGRTRRSGIAFRERRVAPPGSVLIDDVVTTGATVVAAATAMRHRPALVLAATAAPRVGRG